MALSASRRSARSAPSRAKATSVSARRRSAIGLAVVGPRVVHHVAVEVRQHVAAPHAVADVAEGLDDVALDQRTDARGALLVERDARRWRRASRRARPPSAAATATPASRSASGGQRHDVGRSGGCGRRRRRRRRARAGTTSRSARQHERDHGRDGDPSAARGDVAAGVRRRRSRPSKKMKAHGHSSPRARRARTCASVASSFRFRASRRASP